MRNDCVHGRVNGAFLADRAWNIPESAEQPERSNKRGIMYAYDYG